MCWLDPLPPSLHREVESRIEVDPNAIYGYPKQRRRAGLVAAFFLIGVAVGWLAQYW